MSKINKSKDFINEKAKARKQARKSPEQIAKEEELANTKAEIQAVEAEKAILALQVKEANERMAELEVLALELAPKKETFSEDYSHFVTQQVREMKREAITRDKAIAVLQKMEMMSPLDRALFNRPRYSNIAPKGDE